MMNEKYASQIGKIYAISETKLWLKKARFGKYEQKPQVDSNSWSVVDKPDTSTTDDIQPNVLM